MSIPYMTGWEGGAAAWYTATAAAWAGLTFGAFSTVAGNQHRTLAGQGGNWSMLAGWGYSCLPGTVPTTSRWLNHWMKPVTPGASAIAVQFARATVCQVNVRFLGNGTLELYRGSTLLVSLPGAYNPNLNHWLAVNVIAANAGGIIDVWLDGARVNGLSGPGFPTFTGDTQQDAVNADWDHFGWGGNIAPSSAGVNSGGNWYVDDVFVTDAVTGRITETYIIPIVPNGDSVPLTLTPNPVVAHYLNVDEIPANDADYNGTSVSGDQDFYDMTAPPAGSAVVAVNFCARATRDGALTHGEVGITSGATTVYSAAAVLPASPSFLDMQVISEADPDTGVAWTNAGVAAVKAGFRFTT